MQNRSYNTVVQNYIAPRKLQKKIHPSHYNTNEETDENSRYNESRILTGVDLLHPFTQRFISKSQ